MAPSTVTSTSSGKKARAVFAAINNEHNYHKCTDATQSLYASYECPESMLAILPVRNAFFKRRFEEDLDDWFDCMSAGVLRAERAFGRVFMVSSSVEVSDSSWDSIYWRWDYAVSWRFYYKKFHIWYFIIRGCYQRFFSFPIFFWIWNAFYKLFSL